MRLVDLKNFFEDKGVDIKRLKMVYCTPTIRFDMGREVIERMEVVFERMEDDDNE